MNFPWSKEPEAEPTAPEKIPKPIVTDFFLQEFEVPVSRLHIPKTLSEGLDGFTLRTELPESVPEPELHPSVSEAKLEFFSLPSGANPSALMLGALPKMFDRYAYMGVGLRFLLGSLSQLISFHSDQRPIAIPALQSRLAGAPDRVPVIYLREGEASMVKEFKLVSVYSYLKEERWLLPALSRYYRS